MDAVTVIQTFGVVGGLAIIVVVSFAAIARQWARAQATIATATGNAKANAIQADADSQIAVNQIALKALEDKRVADDRFTDLLHESNREIRLLGEKVAAFSAVDNHRNELLERQGKQLEEYEKLTADMWRKYTETTSENRELRSQLNEAKLEIERLKARVQHLENRYEHDTSEHATVTVNPDDDSVTVTGGGDTEG